MKGSGLKPLDESKASDEVVHVFGKNLEERVVTQDDEESQPLSFDTFQDQKKQEEDDIDSIKKRKFDAITGEEDEETVFQGDFKLFVWDLPTSNWIEKGRGQLKLNDSIEPNIRRSRLIMRVSGTLKIILNVALRHSFFKVIANSRTSIRFTDSQTVWAASGSNAHQLKELIDERLKIAAEDETRKRARSDESTPHKSESTDSGATTPSESKEQELKKDRDETGALKLQLSDSAGEDEDKDPKESSGSEESCEAANSSSTHADDDSGGSENKTSPKHSSSKFAKQTDEGEQVDKTNSAESGDEPSESSGQKS